MNSDHNINLLPHVYTHLYFSVVDLYELLHLLVLIVFIVDLYFQRCCCNQLFSLHC